MGLHMSALAEVLTALILFSFIAAVAIAPQYFRARERMKLIELIKSASERGDQIPPELLDTMVADPKAKAPSHIRDRRVGTVLLSVAGAFFAVAICAALTGIIGGDPTQGGIFATVIAGFGALPACLGGAFIALSRIGAPGADS